MTEDSRRNRGRKGRAGVAARSSRREAAAELCAVAGALHAAGLCRGTSGNFSRLLERDPLRFLVTPGGTDKGRLEPETLVAVGADGRPVAGETGLPSAEALLHAVILSRTPAACVLHVHSVAGTLLGEHFAAEGGFEITGYEMLKGLEGVRDHRERVFVPVLENSQDMEELAGRVEGVLRARPALHGLLLAGHGLYAWGATPAHAERHVEVLEFLFECLSRRTPFRPFGGGDRARPPEG